MIYLDANVFATAALEQGEKGEIARRLIAAIQSGKLLGCTSALTVDEVMWSVKKQNGKEAAATIGKTILGLNHLDVCEVSRSIISNAIEHFIHLGLNPRDAIHYATMRVKGIKTIISNDADFDKITDITRKPIENFD